MWPLGFQEDWELGHIVTFDGTLRLVIVPDYIPTVSVADNIYEAWKEWVLIRDNSKYAAAIRVVGGDSTPTGLLGASYFMINNWRIYVSSEVTVTGNIYSDDYASPFLTADNANLVTSTISNLIDKVAPSATDLAGVADASAEAVWAATLSQLQSADTTGKALKDAIQILQVLIGR